MRMVSLFLVSLCIAGIGYAKEPVPVQVVVRTNHPDALYACGEQATFRIVVMDSGKPVTEGGATVVITRDGGEVLRETAVDLGAKNGATVTAMLNRPGFLRVRATYRKGKSAYSGLAGAGFDPEKIEATTVDPKDFDSFWATARAQLAEVPYDVKLTKLDDKSSVNVDCYAISFANVSNTRAYGFLAVPKGRTGPFPAYVTVPGAGPGPFGPSASWAAKGCLSLTMSVHAYDCGTLGKDGINQAYKELNAHGTYSHIGKPDREKFYFYRAILGVDRAIDWLASRSDWDGTHLVIDGSSQGGAFALIMAWASMPPSWTSASPAGPISRAN
jgi:hypothetical protein